MNQRTVGGYTGRLLRVDLSRGLSSDVTFDEPTLRKWLGGSGLGAKILYDEVPPSAQWDDPKNRLILASGPLGGTQVAGTGTFSAVTVGPLTGGSTTTQANGFLGAYMKFAGYDGVILQGRSEKWVYLYLHDGIAELRDASHLLGLDTWEMQDAIAEELGTTPAAISVFGVGPAGENLVHYAAIVGDYGHVAGHNGPGAVMGSKRVKAVVAARGPRAFPIADDAELTRASVRLQEAVVSTPMGRLGFEWGTSMHARMLEKAGELPVNNYATNVFAHTQDFMGESYRPIFAQQPVFCWACQYKHLHTLEVREGPYSGFTGEEPDLEGFMAWGPAIGNPDVAGALVLSNDVDRLGFETNEAGWVVAWVIECYEKGILTGADTDGLEMTWGNVESARALLRKMARREGIGELLAEGVKRASQRVGRGSEELAVYVQKGNSPRGHDHRGRWFEMLDTSVSDTGTVQGGGIAGKVKSFEPFDPEGVSEALALRSGWMVFEDCLGVCRICTRTDLEFIADTVAAATGWDFTAEEAMQVGKRTLNLLRAFNLRRGLTTALEYPSKRYSSTPVDGPAAGKSAVPHWEAMRTNYYRVMGWDLETGRPLPETLAALQLPEASADLWGRE